jgi:hypothetical protein
MAKTIPQPVGEFYIGENPAPQKVIRVRLSATVGDVLAQSQATFHLLKITSKILVFEVCAYTPTAWTTSTTIGIGDTNSTSGWLTTAVIAPTSAQTNGIVKSTDVATAGAYAGGVIYDGSTTNVFIDAVVGGATPVVGITDVYIKYIELTNL